METNEHANRVRGEENDGFFYDNFLNQIQFYIDTETIFRGNFHAFFLIPLPFHVFNMNQTVIIVNFQFKFFFCLLNLSWIEPNQLVDCTRDVSMLYASLKC